MAGNMYISFSCGCIVKYHGTHICDWVSFSIATLVYKRIPFWNKFRSKGKKVTATRRLVSVWKEFSFKRTQVIYYQNHVSATLNMILQKTSHIYSHLSTNTVGNTSCEGWCECHFTLPQLLLSNPQKSALPVVPHRPKHAMSGSTCLPFPNQHSCCQGWDHQLHYVELVTSSNKNLSGWVIPVIPVIPKRVGNPWLFAKILSTTRPGHLQKRAGPCAWCRWGKILSRAHDKTVDGQPAPGEMLKHCKQLYN